MNNKINKKNEIAIIERELEKVIGGKYSLSTIKNAFENVWSITKLGAKAAIKWMAANPALTAGIAVGALAVITGTTVGGVALAKHYKSIKVDPIKNTPEIPGTQPTVTQEELNSSAILGSQLSAEPQKAEEVSPSPAASSSPKPETVPMPIVPPPLPGAALPPPLPPRNNVKPGSQQTVEHVSPGEKSRVPELSPIAKTVLNRRSGIEPSGEDGQDASLSRSWMDLTAATDEHETAPTPKLETAPDLGADPGVFGAMGNAMAGRGLIGNPPQSSRFGNVTPTEGSGASDEDWGDGGYGPSPAN